jgi:Uncharacterised nucleotidyltransferase
MRAGMECVLEILRGQAGCRAVDEGEWDAAFTLAEEQHVLPMVAERVLQSGIVLSDEMRRRLAEARRAAMLLAFFWSSELRGLLRAFAAAQIDVIPLKGPVLAERIYGGGALRSCRDLDLLVTRADFGNAESLLASLDFVPSARADDYHRQWRRGTATVELHFDVENPLAIDFHVAGAWKQSRQSAFEGQPCRELAPEDELLFLCIHGVRHRFERLSLVLDIALAFERYGGSPLHVRDEVTGLGRLILLGSAMAKHLNPQGAVCFDMPGGTSARQRMQALADKLWRQLTEEEFQSVLDWQAQHAFFLEMELTPMRRWFRRIQHMRIAATRLIDSDFDFAARFGLRQRWQVWLLRPARLIFARSRPRA